MLKNFKVTVFVLIIIFTSAHLCFAQGQVSKNKAKPALGARLSLKNVKISKKYFGPEKAQVSFRYWLSKPADVKIEIRNIANNIIQTLTPENGGKNGYNKYSWDARDESGKTLHADAYVYTMRATDEQTGETVIYDERGLTSGKPVSAQKISFDPKTGAIEYFLSEPAFVRLRIGLKDGGPLMRTIFDKEPQGKGRQKIIWDGKDNSGVINLLDDPKILIDITAVSLPKNSFIIKNENEAALKNPEPGFHIKVSAPEIKEEARGEKNTSNKISDKIKVDITVNEESAADLIKAGFEMAFFIDKTFIYEEEKGEISLSRVIDVSMLEEGRHLLTVNLFNTLDRAVAAQSVWFLKE